MNSRRKSEKEMTASEIRDLTQGLPVGSKMGYTKAILNKAQPGIYDELLRGQSGTFPVMPPALVEQVATLLNHKTGLTARAWYAIMPSRAAFHWALKCSRLLGKTTKGNGQTTHFLLSLLTGWLQNEKYQNIKKWAEETISGWLDDAANEVLIASDEDVVFLRNHLRETGKCSGCERCFSAQQRVSARQASEAGEKWARVFVSTAELAPTG